MKQGVAYVLFSNWRTGDSGVDTFVRHVEPLFRDGRIDGHLVEIPYEEVNCRAAESLQSPGGKGGRKPAAKPRGSLRLLAGYLRRVVHDVQALWPLRENLRGRILLTNQFGCETLPLALRILCPTSTLVAICHTHPPRLVSPDRLDRFRRHVEALVYRSVSRMVFNSSSVREEWRKRMALRRIKGEVIWYGIDPPDKTLPADYPERPTDTVDFVCVSRFVHWKGHKELITAFAQAVQRLSAARHPIPNAAARITEHRTRNTAPPSLRLILVGNGPTWKECIQYAEQQRLNPVAVGRVLPEKSPPRNGPVDKWSCQNSPVFFLGSRPNGAAYFNGADVGVQLSIEPEAFGIVLLEAMSRSKPVLASNIGGIPEVVANGETGVLVDARDTERVAGVMVELALDAEKRKRMGHAGAQRWRETFTVSRMQEQYVQMLVQCVQRG